MTIQTHEIDARHVLDVPPELTAGIASGRWRELNLLLHSAALMGDELEGGSSLLPLLRACATIGQADRALLYQWDEAASSLFVAASMGLSELPPDEVLEDNSQAYGSLMHRKPVLVSAPAAGRAGRELGRLGAGSALSVPLVHQGAPWGAVQLLRRSPFLRDEAVLLWIFALVMESSLPAILSRRRRREASSSPGAAAGLLAPAHFRRRLAWEIQRAAWLMRPLSVVCVEVTEMLHGRPRGGSVSFTGQEAAAIVQRALRPQDSVTCLGGHHFVLALPDLATVDAARLADQLRESFLLKSAGTLPVFDIAVGIAEHPGSGTSESDLMRAACASGQRSRSGSPSSRPISRNPRAS
ncbi:MAG TPA: GAF domain-containing protein [Candidatus Polarisedimenticolia bacterium]|nr:GAF domain-containing protein [Candidatus Polarisedimenticolia bacterium]